MRILGVLISKFTKAPSAPVLDIRLSLTSGPLPPPPPPFFPSPTPQQGSEEESGLVSRTPAGNRAY